MPAEGAKKSKSTQNLVQRLVEGGETPEQAIKGNTKEFSDAVLSSGKTDEEKARLLEQAANQKNILRNKRDALLGARLPPPPPPPVPAGGDVGNIPPPLGFGDGDIAPPPPPLPPADDDVGRMDDALGRLNQADDMERALQFMGAARELPQPFADIPSISRVRRISSTPDEQPSKPATTAVTPPLNRPSMNRIMERYIGSVEDEIVDPTLTTTPEADARNWIRVQGRLQRAADIARKVGTPEQQQHLAFLQQTHSQNRPLRIEEDGSEPEDEGGYRPTTSWSPSRRRLRDEDDFTDDTDDDDDEDDELPQARQVFSRAIRNLWHPDSIGELLK